MGSSAVNHWNDFLQFIHATSFGIKEPVFGKDAGFYVFKLPVYRFLVNRYIFIVVITVIGVLVSYYLDSAMNLGNNKLNVSKRVKNHLVRLAGLFMLGISASFFLQLYGKLYASQGPAYGPSYVTVHAQIPANWAIFGVSVVLTILLFLMPLIKKYRLLLVINDDGMEPGT